MTAIRGIIFDKDGTLFDFHRTWGEWSRRLMAELAGGDAGRARALGAAVGFDVGSGVFAPGSLIIAHTPDEIAEALLPLLPGTGAAALVARMNALAAEVAPVPAAPLRPVIEALRHGGRRIGLATNDGEVPARAHLAAAGVADLFDFVAGFDSGFGGKPETGQLLAFARATALTPRQIVMVGDSRHDLEAGRQAGMGTVAVLTGVVGHDDLAPYADVVLPDIGHLPAWLDRRDPA